MSLDAIFPKKIVSNGLCGTLAVACAEAEPLDEEMNFKKRFFDHEPETRQNLAIERTVQKAIDACDHGLGFDRVIPKARPKFEYTAALLMLSIAAILAIVVDV